MKENTKNTIFYYPHKTPQGYVDSYAIDQVIETIENENGVFDICLSDYVFDTMTIELMNKMVFKKNEDTLVDVLLKSIDDLKMQMFFARKLSLDNQHESNELKSSIIKKSQEITKKYIDFMKGINDE